MPYPIHHGLPDFLGEEMAHGSDAAARRLQRLDRSMGWLARLYETRLWYPLVITIYGGVGALSFKQLIQECTTVIAPISGRVLDAACGPGTYGRRVASSTCQVFGVDISTGMLRQGMRYVQQEHNPHIRFARARVEALPFRDTFFDGVLCCGSLHLFADPPGALREISRSLKPGAPLVVFTFTQGKTGLLKYSAVRQRLHNGRLMKVFSPDELERMLQAAGFTLFRPKVYGSILVFSAQREDLH